MIFKQLLPNRSVIGAVHFSPLLGYPGFIDVDQILEKAKNDVSAFERGGVDGIILENNYDTPHEIHVKPETIACMTYLVSEIRKLTTLPLGVSVLWNDYLAALAIAKVSKSQFIRVPVFVDEVRTNYGQVKGEPQRVIEARRELDAESVLLLTDIHVKHAELVSTLSLQQSARKAIEEGSDGLIITGKWTGDAPKTDDLQSVRDIVGDFPVIVGSGATSENIATLFQLADSVIVGTAVKSGQAKKEEINVKSYDEVVDEKKVRTFVTAAKQV